MDPVTLGLASQIDLDLEVSRASKGAAPGDIAEQGTMLLTAEEALAGAHGRAGMDHAEDDEHTERRPEREEELDADSVFAKLKSLKGDSEE
jgi:hypothetical protein